MSTGSGPSQDGLPPPPGETGDDTMPPLLPGQEADAVFLNQEDVLEEFDVADGESIDDA